MLSICVEWAAEYGMPSTHAMLGLAVPASVLLFTLDRYQYPPLLWAGIARYTTPAPDPMHCLFVQPVVRAGVLQPPLPGDAQRG